MLGYYIRSRHVIMCSMHETWGLFYSRAMRTLPHIMPCVTAHAVMSCTHCAVHACRQAGHPNYTWMPGFTYGHAVHASRTIFIKNNRLTF